MDWPQTEVELAAVVVDWLRGLGFIVYQEVQVKSHGRSADIVARRSGIVWVIEAKLSLSLDVVEQALKWAGNAHYVAVAVPKGHRRHTSLLDGNLMSEVLEWKGVGLILADGDGSVVEQQHPKIHRRANTAVITSALTERHETFASAGNADGQRYTPFRRTCDNLADIAAGWPGIQFKAALERLRHHYPTEQAAERFLFEAGTNGKIPGVKFQLENKHWTLWPAGTSKRPLTTLGL